MAVIDTDSAYQRLRKYLNPNIEGKNTKLVLETLSEAIALIDYNAQAINDQCTIAKASAQYLDNRLADYGLTRPPEIGMLDDIFRRIGVAVINRKQVRDLINQLLSILFGDDVAQANMVSENAEPYLLQNDDELKIRYDDGDILTITFRTQDFQSIGNATAQEVADSITKQIRSQGKTGRAFAQDNGDGAKVYLISDTIGPRGSVQVYGGRAQDVLEFPLQRDLTPDATTEWQISSPPTGRTRLTWTGVGGDPSLGLVRVGDYINVFGLNFDPDNRGSFEITVINTAQNYVEFENPNAVPETTVQGVSAPVRAYSPKRITVIDQFRYAVQFQEEQNLLEIYIPATTRVVRRSRKGAAYIQDRGFSTPETRGPYTFDPTATFNITAVQSVLDQDFGPNQGNIITLQTGEAVDFPDARGFLVLGLGSDVQEGPIPYLARPSDSTLLLSPAYVVQKSHPARVQRTTGADGTTVVDLTKTDDIMTLESVGGTPFDFVANGVKAGDIVTLGSQFDPINQLPYGILDVTPTAITFQYYSGVAETGIVLGAADQVSIVSAGTDVALVNQGSYIPNINADDFQFFLTDNTAGRIYAEDLIRSIAAAGVKVLFTIIYPNPIGLGSWQQEDIGNEKKYVWGRDYRDVYEES